MSVITPSLFCAGVQIQGFMQARQAHCPLSYIPSSGEVLRFVLFCFEVLSSAFLNEAAEFQTSNPFALGHLEIKF